MNAAKVQLILLVVLGTLVLVTGVGNKSKETTD